MKRRGAFSDHDRIQLIRGEILVAAGHAGWDGADLSALCDEWFALRFDSLNLRQLEQLALHFRLSIQKGLPLDGD